MVQFLHPRDVLEIPFFFHILPSLMVQHTISPSGRRVTVDRGITPIAEFLMQLVGIL